MWPNIDNLKGTVSTINEGCTEPPRPQKSVRDDLSELGELLTQIEIESNRIRNFISFDSSKFVTTNEESPMDMETEVGLMVEQGRRILSIMRCVDERLGV